MNIPSVLPMSSYTGNWDTQAPPDNRQESDRTEAVDDEVYYKDFTNQQKFYYNNRETFKTIFDQWAKWSKRKNFVSEQDLRDISKKNPDKKARAAAQFLLDQKRIFNKLDTEHMNESRGDKKISTRDLGKWLERNDIFGNPLIAHYRPYLKAIADCWDYWNGKDAIVAFKDLKNVSEGIGPDDLPDELKIASKVAAKWLLKNPDLRFFLDILGGHNSTDGAVGNSYFDYHDGQIGSDFQQNSKYGNCVAVSVLGALSQTEQGAKIITDSIHVDENTGDFIVQFKGDPNHKAYRITRKETQDDAWSRKDIDLKVLNIALNKYAHEHPDTIAQGNNLTNGTGYAFPILGLITKRPTTIADKKDVWTFISNDNFIGKLNNGLLALCIGTGFDKEGNINRSGVANHEFFAEKIDKNTNSLTYVNPWDARKKRTINLYELYDIMASTPFSVMEFVDFSRPRTP